MDALYIMEITWIEQLPRPEDIYLMRPDPTSVVKAKRKIQKEKCFWIDYQADLADQQSTPIEHREAYLLVN
jgi:hypothetical protein